LFFPQSSFKIQVNWKLFAEQSFTFLQTTGYKETYR
jgi:hypothetical protein